MRNELRSPVEIVSRDYWLKALENTQTNWALVDQDSVNDGCTVFFFHELSGVFDRLRFVSLRAAQDALRFNGFERLADLGEARSVAPRAPFFADEHPNGTIYSSGRYWKTFPDSKDTELLGPG